jgi:hypothetical protein
MFSTSTKTFGALTVFTSMLAMLVASIQPDRAAVTILMVAALCFGLVTAAGRNATGHNDRAGVAGASTTANRAPRNSYAPALAAIGGGVMVLGAALGAPAYIAGALALLVAGGLWLSDTWREHPLSTPKLSAQVSRSFSLPIVMPLLSLVLIAFIAISFSLVFFSFPESQSYIVASVIAVLIFGGGFILAFLPAKAGRAKFLSLAALLLVTIAALGVVGYVRGEPEHGEHEGTHSEKSEKSETKTEATPEAKPETPAEG